jgi:exonuclease III
MDLPRVKYSRGKIVPHLDLQAGTTLGGPGQRQPTQDSSVECWWFEPCQENKTLEDKEIDAFCIFEAKVMEEAIKCFHFKNYHLNFLPKSRQIASGILIGTHKPLKHIFSIVKKMNSVDKTKIIRLNVWKNENHIKVFGIYNPHQNNPALSLLDVTK